MRNNVIDIGNSQSIYDGFLARFSDYTLIYGDVDESRGMAYIYKNDYGIIGQVGLSKLEEFKEIASGD